MVKFVKYRIENVIDLSVNNDNTVIETKKIVERQFTVDESKLTGAILEIYEIFKNLMTENGYEIEA